MFAVDAKAGFSIISHSLVSEKRLMNGNFQIKTDPYPKEKTRLQKIENT